MWATRGLIVVSLAGLLSAADVASAQFAGPWAQGFQEGYSRGVRAGEEDSRRGQSFNFTDEGDYRNGNAGYRSQYGPVDRYRTEFRRGYEQGYRTGYDRSGRGGYGGYDDRYGGPPYGRARGRGPGYGRGQDPGYGSGYTRRAFDMGYNDGYEAGLDDGRDGRRLDPVAESRYRSGDRGYEREYGSREAYKIDYRNAFRQGYEAGYNDGRRYGTRRWWNPFERRNSSGGLRPPDPLAPSLAGAPSPRSALAGRARRRALISPRTAECSEAPRDATTHGTLNTCDRQRYARSECHRARRRVLQADE